MLQKIKKHKGTIITAVTGAILGSFIGGAITTTKLSDSYEAKMDSAIEEVFGRTYPFSVTLDVWNNNKPLELPQSFSDVEEIVGDVRERSWLAQRIGFTYHHDDTTPDPDKIFRGVSLGDWGTRITYRVVESNLLANNYSDAMETMYLSNYEGNSSPSSSVSLHDWDRDGHLDYINISDEINNTRIVIMRERTKDTDTKNSKMIADGINEQGARVFIDYYTARFHKFKQDHDIEERLKNYQTKLEIRESYSE